jgi:hypothetical protein
MMTRLQHRELRCTTSWTILGSILGGVTGFFSDVFPSDPTMALGSTQLLVKMSTRNISGGKGSWCVRLTNSPPSRAKCHEIWKPKPPGTISATPGMSRDSFSDLVIQEGCGDFFLQNFWLHFFFLWHVQVTQIDRPVGTVWISQAHEQHTRSLCITTRVTSKFQ